MQLHVQLMIKNTRMMLLALHPVLKISSLIPMTALNSQQI